MDKPDAADNGSNPGIQPTQFIPSGEAVASARIHRWHVVLATFIVVALFIFWFLFTSKSVQLRFEPAPSEVSVSGGVSFELGGVYLLREGTYQISANSPLHEPMRQDIEVTSERNQVVNLNFTPLPGFLSLQLYPLDAEVAVNGEPRPHLQPLELPAGQHELEVSHARYLPSAQIVDIEGKQIEQSLAVKLQPNWAEVRIASTPPGAQVWLDNEDLQQVTPATIEALAGEREIRVQLNGYKSHRERIFAQAGVALTLAPIKLVQADAQLRLTSSPSSAGVTVNGQFVGQTPLQLDLKSNHAHRIAIIRNGYQSYSRSKTLKRGENASLHANLVQQRGEVIIHSQPAGALLSINGKPMGAADQALQLPIRPHQVAITLDGHAGYSQTITPKVGLTQEIKVKLLSVEEARLRAMKPNITSAGGQNLKLFQPFDFTMGASRREPGRRANETLREIAMSRLFYLATQEVTNAQFRQFASGHDSGTFEEVTLNEDDMPASSVSWHDAAAYCNWLSNRDNLPEFYEIEYGKVIGTNSTARGYRLPTEAEWAWAARTYPKPQNDVQLRFPWGANLPPPDRQGNYADRAASALVGRVIFGYNDNQTAAAPVGTFKANQRGIFDMGGNVAEWTHDFYEIPKPEPAADPIGPISGEYHVMRGSSWMHGTITELRLSFRDYGIQGRQDVGFRIARYAE